MLGPTLMLEDGHYELRSFHLIFKNFLFNFFFFAKSSPTPQLRVRWGGLGAEPRRGVAAGKQPPSPAGAGPAAQAGEPPPPPGGTQGAGRLQRTEGAAAARRPGSPTPLAGRQTPEPRRIPADIPLPAPRALRPRGLSPRRPPPPPSPARGPARAPRPYPTGPRPRPPCTTSWSSRRTWRPRCWRARS